MIAPPDGWRRIASVGADIFASPDRRVQIRYRTRLAPLRRVAAIVDDALAELPEWRTREVGQRDRFVTHEGEHAFGIPISGTWLDTEARRYLGIVYGDDFFDVVDAISLGAASIEDRARAIVRGAALRLGVRRRRYFYDRPFGWHGHATGLTTHWFPATFPARPTTIVVYPANPTNEQPQAILDAMIAHHAALGAELHQTAAPTPVASHAGLEGVAWQLACISPQAPAIVRDLVVYARGAYTYALQLDAYHAADEAARALFLAIAQSVEPVPAIAAGDTTAGNLFSHYV